MPRQNRLNVPGCIFHIISRGIERKKIFLDDKDREDFLERLSGALSKTGYQCYAWALMSNHFHLLLRSSQAPISDLMRSLMSGYAVCFNIRHKRRGVLFQNRYKSILCQEDAYLSQLVRYIHLNPIRAKVVLDLNALKRYPWTGHSVIMGKVKREFQEVNEILSLFGTKKGKALSSYSDFLSDGIELGRREDLTGGGLRRSAGGWVGVQLLKKGKEYWQGDERILGESNFVSEILTASEEKLDLREKLKRDGWCIKRLAKEICKNLSVESKDLFEKGRSNKLSHAKAAISYLSNKKLGLSRKAIAEFFNVSGPAISYLIKRGEDVVAEHKLEALF